jgi:hypothetical protein
MLVLCMLISAVFPCSPFCRGDTYLVKNQIFVTLMLLALTNKYLETLALIVVFFINQ